MRNTVEMLNSKKWITAQGEILDPCEMEKDHISNCMAFLYRKRDYLLYNSTPEIIQECKNPDEFFERFVTRSVLWGSFLDALKRPKDNIIKTYEGLYEDRRYDGTYGDGDGFA